MARDDYFVIVYKILTYLYQCLKEGRKAEERLLTHDSSYIKVNEKYWNYILWHMQKAELIEGVEFLDNNLEDIPYPLEWDKCKDNAYWNSLSKREFPYEEGKGFSKRYKRNNTIYIKHRFIPVLF